MNTVSYLTTSKLFNLIGLKKKFKHNKMELMKFKLLILLVFATLVVVVKEYHVSVKGSDKNDGSAVKPFRTINFAAQLAQAGDIITVHAGTYREWINPRNGGESDTKRIVYRAAPGEKVEIKGSEIISGWRREKGGVWKLTIPNSFFGNHNPCNNLVFGDWCDIFSQR